MLDNVAFPEADREAECRIGNAPHMVLVGGVDLAALGRIELDALAFLTDEFVLDLLEVPPVPDARRPIRRRMLS